jgi:tRNA(His) guanylyltransferase
MKRTGDKIKNIEKKFRTYLDPSKPTVVRLDGHKFSSFTKEMQKPYEV